VNQLRLVLLRNLVFDSHLATNNNSIDPIVIMSQKEEEGDGLHLSPVPAAKEKVGVIPSSPPDDDAGSGDSALNDSTLSGASLDHLEMSFREILTASFSKKEETTSENERQSRRQSLGLVDIMSTLKGSFQAEKNNHKSLLDFFSHGETSDWEEGVAVIESVLLPNSEARRALSESQIQGLRKVQQLLWAGPQTTTTAAHVPKALLDTAPEPGSTSDYILAQFAGIKRVKAKQKFLNVVNANRFLYRLKLHASSSRRLNLASKEIFVPPEWTRLGIEERIKLADLLSWEHLQKWDFDVFELDRLTNGQPLMFVGWAILASPYSQHVMQESVYVLQKEEQAAQEEEGKEAPTPTPPPALDDMQGWGYTDVFKIPQDNLVNFLRAVEREYITENPYHNNIHAADVVQSLHSLLQGMDAKSLSTAEIELFSLLLAAVVHDMGHPGKNNSFQVNSHSDLAIQYNDHSVLENMHASLAFKVLLGDHKDPSRNIFAGMTKEQVAACRKMIIDSVLETDMTHHFSSVNKIKGILLLHKDTMGKNKGGDTKDFKFKDDDALEILHFVLHLADISNQAKLADLAVMWTDRCLEEFFQQGDEEKRLGLPVSPLCDRMSTQRADSQIGFIKFVVQPAYDLLGRFVPEVRRQILPALESNLKFWIEQKKSDRKLTILEASERSSIDASQRSESRMAAVADASEKSDAAASTEPEASEEGEASGTKETEAST
jgi:hypothetical protein